MNRLVPHRKTRAGMHNWSRRGRKYATFLLLAVVVLSLTTTAVNAASSASPATSGTNASPLVGATTHPIQYAIAGPPSMVDDGSSLAYFKAHGFSIVELVVPDNGTYQAELNTIKALGMQPIIDVEVVIWNGGNSPPPIASFSGYFQSLKNTGWEYVASEGLNSTDLAYMQQFFEGYVNYNCDQCGLWQGLYENPFTVLNSWESYYTSEWPYIQNGSTQAAALGIQNGIMAGLWENVSGDNPILANSQSGGTPSYQSMLNWSYANGIGFSQFCVWCGNDASVLSDYESLGFPQIVANLQAEYPPTSSAAQLSLIPSNATPTVGQSTTFSGTLQTTQNSTTIGSAIIQFQSSTDNTTWSNVATDVTNATGGYQFSCNESAAGTYYFRTTYAGNATYANATSNTVSVNVTTTQLTPVSSPAVTAQNASSLYLFVRGSDNALWYKYWTGTTWTAATSLGGVLTSSPAATSPAAGTIDVFVCGSDGALYEKTTANSGTSWSNWISLSGQIPAGTAPAACSWGAGRLDLFVQGMNGALYHKSYTGTSWSSWENLGGVLTSSPAATSPAAGTIDVFVLGSDNGLWWQTTTNSAASWSGWMSAGGI